MGGEWMSPGGTDVAREAINNCRRVMTSAFDRDNTSVQVQVANVIFHVMCLVPFSQHHVSSFSHHATATASSG